MKVEKQEVCNDCQMNFANHDEKHEWPIQGHDNLSLDTSSIRRPACSNIHDLGFLSVPLALRTFPSNGKGIQMPIHNFSG
jgi:hypothetical protein